MPLLSAWAMSSTHDARNAGRSRFQLDAPIIAGRSFFEMVTFMLDELKILEKEVIDRGFKTLAHLKVATATFTNCSLPRCFAIQTSLAMKMWMKCEIGYSHGHMPCGSSYFVCNLYLLTTEREVKTMQINRLCFATQRDDWKCCP